jgi:putative flippase GtrA
VFKGKQDKAVTKSTKFIILFIVFSAIAYGLSFLTYEGCRILFSHAPGVNINECSIDYILKFQFWGDLVFWLYTVAFVLKTLVGLVWNYFTRKYILYKRKPEQVQE